VNCANFVLMPYKKILSPTFRFNFKKTGFTLIEVMVSLAIMGFVAAVAMPNIRNFSKTQELDASVSQLSTILKRAQSSAASRIECGQNNASTSWQVDFNVASANYILVSNCQTPPAKTVFTSPFAPTPTSPSVFQAATVPCAGENMSIIYTGSQMSYKCANSSGPVYGTAVTITLSGSGLTKSIVVEPGGTIR